MSRTPSKWMDWWMTAAHWSWRQKWAIGLILAVVVGVVVLGLMYGCGGIKIGGGPKPVSHTAGTVLAPPTSAPATAEEWTRLTIELDRAKAELDEIRSANSATWERFGTYSWLLVVPGIAIVVLSVLPFAAFLGAFRNVGFMLLGLGTVFALVPHAVATYGVWAMLPTAITAGLYVFVVAALDIWRRVKRARQEALVCAAALDPQRPVGLRDVIDVRSKHNPMFKAQLEKLL